jgi:outer membrane protein OmpA-like peptidoglycan-associated protein
MKKFFMLLALASVSVAGMAQDELTEKYSVATNSFWSNWFVQGNVTWNSFYYGDVHKFGSTPFHKFGLGSDMSKEDTKHPTALGFSVAVGKWFTPGLGLRTKANFAWLGKAFDKNSQTYLSLNEQALFNLSNLLYGYNPNRVWNFIPYAGLGVARNFDQKANSFVASAGLLNTFRLSNRVALNLDLGYYSFEKAIVGGLDGGIHPKARYNQLALEAGVTVNLGKGTWNKVPDVDAIKALHQSQLDALNAQLADANAENSRLNNLIKNHKCPEATSVTVKEVAAAPVSVFFNIGKAKVASKKDLVNLKALAEVAKDNDKTLVVTGYADSKTGSASFNQNLSQKRAETVKKELVKLGVAENKIETVAAGGVNDVTPISYNRRAVVTVK